MNGQWFRPLREDGVVDCVVATLSLWSREVFEVGIQPLASVVTCLKYVVRPRPLQDRSIRILQVR